MFQYALFFVLLKFLTLSGNAVKFSFRVFKLAASLITGIYSDRFHYLRQWYTEVLVEFRISVIHLHRP